MLGGPLEAVDDKSKRRLDGVHPRVLRHVLLEDVVLNGTAELPGIDALLFRRRDVEAVEDYSRAVDRHRRGNLIQRNAVEKRLHVSEARDCDATLPYLSLGSGMIRVITHQRRKIESNGKTCLAVGEQEFVSVIRVARAAETGELAHRPQAAPITCGVNAARVWIHARHAERVRTCFCCVERRIDRLKFLFGIIEADIAELALFVFLAPLSDLLAQQTQFSALSFDGLDQLTLGGSSGAGTLKFGHVSSSPRTSSPLWRNSWSAMPKGVAIPSSTDGSCCSSQLMVPVSFHRRPRTFCSTTSMTRSRILSRLRARRVPLS